MTSQSHSTWEQLRSLVRSSSTGRCGRWRWKKKRSCRGCACSPARDSKAGNGGLSKALRPAKPPKDLVLRPEQRAPGRPGTGRGFQPGQGGVAPGSERGAARLTAKGRRSVQPGHACHRQQGQEWKPLSCRRTGTCAWDCFALRVHALGGSTAAFHLAPGTHRSRDWPCTR
jgi:hypothetical protein